MKQYKQIVETTIIDENGEETKRTNKTLHILRSWNELTDEEKEKEIESNSEMIYQDYQDMLYEDFKFELDEIRNEFKDITFDDIYFDSSSHGSWIDCIKGFKLNRDIEVYGERLWVDDVDLHLSKYIREDFEIYVDDYYVESDKLARIKETKKYQDWLSDNYTYVSKWIDRVNEISKYMLDREYTYPYNIHGPEDADYLANWFEGQEFETIENIDEGEQDENN